MEIKAKLVTHNLEGKRIRKDKKLSAWFCFNEKPKMFEIMLTDEGEVMQSVYVSAASVAKALKGAKSE